MKEEFHSRVYTDRPTYADFDAPHKFQAIQGIIATRLRQHPNAICSYSGGADSDILIDLIERTRMMIPSLPTVDYVFFNTGLEMQATKDHVKATAEKYGIEIEECRPKISIVTAVRRCGVPFLSKRMSRNINDLQKKKVSISIVDEYNKSENKPEKFSEIVSRYKGCKVLIRTMCCTDKDGNPVKPSQHSFNSAKYLLDFLSDCPPDFEISAKCCDYCKKEPAHDIQKHYDMIITGEREAEGGARSEVNINNGTMCFFETGDGKFRLRPLYYVSNKDKAWYKEYYGVRYSDAYEVYGLTRTGCCGCPISYKAVEDLEKIAPYEPNVVKAAWNIFGKSYEYRKKYNEYKKARMDEEKIKSTFMPGQMTIFDMEEEQNERNNHQSAD